MLVHMCYRTFMGLHFSSIFHSIYDGHKRRCKLWFMISFFARYIFARKCGLYAHTRGGIDKSLTHKYLNPITSVAFFVPSIFDMHGILSLPRLFFLLLLVSHLIFHFQTLAWRVGIWCMVNLSARMRARVRLF